MLLFKNNFLSRGGCSSRGRVGHLLIKRLAVWSHLPHSGCLDSISGEIFTPSSIGQVSISHTSCMNVCVSIYFWSLKTLCWRRPAESKYIRQTQGQAWTSQTILKGNCQSVFQNRNVQQKACSNIWLIPNVILSSRILNVKDCHVSTP